jgi:hypothetical protein
MRWFQVFINGEEQDAIAAASYAEARRAAKRLYRISCDVIG